MISAVAEIARHEIAVILRTRRALAMLLVYLGSALLVGFAYALSVRFVEKDLLEGLSERTGSPVLTDQAVGLLAAPMYQSLLSYLADAPLEQLDPSLLGSPILPFLLWGSLAFLPFLILLTSFDQIASDLETRALCFSSLRVPRTALLLGKALGHVLLFGLLSTVASLLLLALTAALVEQVDVVASLPGLMRLLLLLSPFGAAYVGLSSFCSVATGRPFPALLLAVTLAATLRMMSWLRFIPETSDAAFLRPLRWASPSMYESGFWQRGLAEPAASAGAYLAMGVLFFIAGVLVMRRRRL